MVRMLVIKIIFFSYIDSHYLYMYVLLCRSVHLPEFSSSSSYSLSSSNGKKMYIKYFSLATYAYLRPKHFGFFKYIITRLPGQTFGPDTIPLAVFRVPCFFLSKHWFLWLLGVTLGPRQVQNLHFVSWVHFCWHAFAVFTPVFLPLRFSLDALYSVFVLKHPLTVKIIY